MDDYVQRLFEHGFWVRRNHDAPGRIRRADDFSEVASSFGGVFVNCRDDFERIFLAHQADDGRADGAEAVLGDADFLFHFGVPEWCKEVIR